ncbi:MAG: ferrous iron transport protein A [Deltaproteobacteria bacterium]|nr:ferrous iron transport protein A [Deltaproteobacteria bacterium]
METMVLSKVDQGKEVTLAHIKGGRGMKSKLHSMGLVPGAAFTVLSRSRRGPVILRVKDTRLAIGQGMAQRMIVE